jgi:hypothetical protein
MRTTKLFTVENGVVTDITAVDAQRVEGSSADGQRTPNYKEWLSQNHPQDHAELFYNTTIIINDAEKAERHHTFVAEWAAATTS